MVHSGDSEKVKMSVLGTDKVIKFIEEKDANCEVFDIYLLALFDPKYTSLEELLDEGKLQLFNHNYNSPFDSFRHC